MNVLAPSQQDRAGAAADKIIQQIIQQLQDHHRNRYSSQGAN
jgi:hypothetical protein